MSVLLESRSFRPFKSSEEYLYAMKEDLAEWLSGLYPDLYINVVNFMDRLDTGVALCKHANNVRKYAEEYVKRRQTGQGGPGQGGGRRQVSFAGSLVGVASVRYLPGAKPGTFFARDNVSNFIAWCRKGLGVIECLLFETDDLIMRKNEKHVILCLMEVARQGARLGMPAPMLVQLEREIDREIAADKRQLKRGMSQLEIEEFDGEVTDDDDDEDVSTQFGPLPQIVTNDLKSLDEMVRDLVEKCTCPTQFPMIRVSEGKYRIGDTKVLIFVRVLRSHVMVRVGGGWDTLAHYLDKHDPCRCKTAHRAPVSTKVVGMRMGGPAVELTHAQVHYDRSPPRTRRSSASSIGSNGGNGGNGLSLDARTLSPRKSTTDSDRARDRSLSPALNTLSPSGHPSRNSTLASRQRSRSPSQQRSRSPTPRTHLTANPNTQSSDNVSLKSRSRSPTPRRASCQASSKNRSRSTTPMRPKQPSQEPKKSQEQQQTMVQPQVQQVQVLSPLTDKGTALKEELLKQISAKQSSLPLDIEAQIQQYQQPLPVPTDNCDSGVDTSPAHKVSDNFTNITKITINPPPSSPTHINEISSGVDTTPSRKISENFDVPEHSKRSIKYGSINALDSFGTDPQTNNDSGSEVSDEGYRSLGIVNTSTPGSNAVTTPQGSPVRVARVARSRSLGGQESPPPPQTINSGAGSASVSSSPFRRHTPASRSARHPAAHHQPHSTSINRTWNSGSKKQRPAISSDTFCKQVADIMQQYAAMMPSPRKDSKPDSGITRIPAPVHKT